MKSSCSKKHPTKFGSILAWHSASWHCASPSSPHAALMRYPEGKLSNLNTEWQKMKRKRREQGQGREVGLRYLVFIFTLNFIYMLKKTTTVKRPGAKLLNLTLKFLKWFCMFSINCNCSLKLPVCFDKRLISLHNFSCLRSTTRYPPKNSEGTSDTKEIGTRKIISLKLQRELAEIPNAGQPNLSSWIIIFPFILF